MRFTTGLLIGLGAGFILGAKAGQERYDQLQDALAGLVASDSPLTFSERAVEAYDRLRGPRIDVEVDLIDFDEPLEP
jgi:hypothetical protein